MLISSYDNTAYIVEIGKVDMNGDEKKENLTYIIDKPKRDWKSRFLRFVRETLGFVKET